METRQCDSRSGCPSPATLSCSRCWQRVYCGAECQADDWNNGRHTNGETCAAPPPIWLNAPRISEPDPPPRAPNAIPSTGINIPLLSVGEDVTPVRHESPAPDFRGGENLDPDANPQTLERGRVISGLAIPRYTIDRKLGQGSFGAVYSATTDQGVRYALKVFDPRDRHEQVDEYAVLQMVGGNPSGSDRVVWVVEAFLFQGLPIIVMPLLGPSLARLISDTERSIPIGRVVEMIHDIAVGTLSVHRAGLVHGDIKPANLVFHRDWPSGSSMPGDYTLILADLGSASGALVHPGWQSGGTVPTTASVRAPEMCVNLPWAGEVDAWAIGIVALQLYTGYDYFSFTASVWRRRLTVHAFNVNHPAAVLIMLSSYGVLLDQDVEEVYDMDDWKDRHRSDIAAARITTGVIGEIRSFSRSLDDLFAAVHRPDDSDDDRILRETIETVIRALLRWRPEQRWSVEEVVHHTSSGQIDSARRRKTLPPAQRRRHAG